MSMLSDIKSTLSQKKFRDKLSIEERAELLVQITNDLEWDEYDELSSQGINKAIEDLKETDEEMKRNNI